MSVWKAKLPLTFFIIIISSKLNLFSPNIDHLALRMTLNTGMTVIIQILGFITKSQQTCQVKPNMVLQVFHLCTGIVEETIDISSFKRDN